MLQSTQVAAKHTGCCKPHGVLQSTRGAAKHKGCCKAHGVMSLYYIYIYLHMFVLDGAVPTSSPIYNLHSGQGCQVFQLMMPEYCDENNFSTGSDRACRIFKATVCFGQLRLIYIYTHFDVSCCCCFPALSKNKYRSDGYLNLLQLVGYKSYKVYTSRNFLGGSSSIRTAVRLPGC